MTTLDLSHAADLLQCSKAMVRKMCKINDLPHRRIGKLYLFVREDLEAWIRSGMKGAKAS